MQNYWNVPPHICGIAYYLYRKNKTCNEQNITIRNVITMIHTEYIYTQTDIERGNNFCVHQFFFSLAVMCMLCNDFFALFFIERIYWESVLFEFFLLFSHFYALQPMWYSFCFCSTIYQVDDKFINNYPRSFIMMVDTFHGASFIELSCYGCRL